MALDPSFWRGRRVLLTGHTGFKGGWAAMWLQRLGASISGYALAPQTNPSLYRAARIDNFVASPIAEFCDIHDREALSSTFAATMPEIVIHMAAQPLVRVAFEQPLMTYSTNVMGTANVLAAAHECGSVRTIVAVTSDKCYDLREGGEPRKESDPLGGAEPYAASKAGAEFIAEGMRAMMTADPERGEGNTGLATARGGNMLGGGDWSRDRLMPDLVAGALGGQPVAIRNPDAVRPWQHVLDPLRGYFVLAQRLHQNAALFEGPWNFGPPASHAVPVRHIADAACALLDAGLTWRPDPAAHFPESRSLRLNSEKAAARLDWRSRLTLADALDWSVRWYKKFDTGADARVLMEADIDRYEALAVA